MKLILQSFGIIFFGFFFCAMGVSIFSPEPLYSHLYGIFFAILYLAGVTWIATGRIIEILKNSTTTSGSKEGTVSMDPSEEI